MRLRSRQDWIPLTLPDHLQIVDRALWERVQRRLDQSRAFSPRNSKHAYLLRGLLRCGGCPSAYVGSPCHGHYYYRCAARCRRVPAVKAEIVDDTVWAAMTELLLKPDLLLDKLEALLARQSSAPANRDIERRRRTKSARQITAEEERLLEAYRLGQFSPANLAKELEQLKSRRSALERSPETMSSDTLRPTLVVESVAHFLRLVADRLNGLDFEGRQTLLRRLITSIVFEGDLLRIRGHIPAFGPSNPPASPTSNTQPSNPETQGEGDNAHSLVFEKQSSRVHLRRNCAHSTRAPCSQSCRPESDYGHNTHMPCSQSAGITLTDIPLDLHGRDQTASLDFELVAPFAKSTPASDTALAA